MARSPCAVVMIVLALLLGAGVAAGLLIGHGSLSDPEMRGVFLSLRGYRLTAACLAGAGLACGGVLMQGLFRNPLASPDILGCSAGAYAGGQVVLLGYALIAASLPQWVVPEMLLPLGCLTGAAASLFIILGIARRSPGLTTLLLIGVILTSFYAACSAFLTSLSQDAWQIGRAMIAFTLGGLDGRGLVHVLLALPLVLVGVIAAWFWGRPLDVLLAGEEEAATLGVDVRQVTRWILVWTAVLTAAAVALGGGVSFVGIVVPHALRRFVGVSHRRLLPAAALGGAAYLVLCDDLTRCLPMTGEVPLGVITGLIGAPVFLLILLRGRRELS